MDRRCLKLVVSLGVCVALLVALPHAARAATKEELIDRMAKRLDDLRKHKADGKIGETFGGLIEAVKPEYLDDKGLKKLVDDENADRKEFYELGAKQVGTTPQKFGESAARRNFKKARKGEWLKNKEGKWEQKKGEDDGR